MPAHSINCLGRRGECIDGDERCSGWAIQGECSKNPAYMLTTCRKSCKTCKEDKAKANKTASV